MAEVKRPVEYASPEKWGTWPLVHVSLGGIGADGRYVAGRARGLIAVGDHATGLIAIGQVARGIIAVGVVSLGVIAVGAFTLGVIAVGGLAIGLTAAGPLPGILSGSRGSIFHTNEPWFWLLGALAILGVAWYLIYFLWDRKLRRHAA